MDQILNNNKELIERYVDLATCTDQVFDSLHQWFYSELPKEQLLSIGHIVSREDVQQDIILFILEQQKQYTGKDLSSYLKLAIGRHVRDKMRAEINRKISAQVPTCCFIDLMGMLDLRWALSARQSKLTDYERYILYLDLYKCYTLNQICSIVYQDRSTLRSSLRTAKEILKQEIL